MSNLDSLLAANRQAVDELIAAAERCESVWTQPRAPKKWSPSQIVEHVRRAIEEGGNVVAERPTRLPTLPFFIRPLAHLLYRRVLKKGAFPKARTNKAMDPISGPATVDEGRQGLLAALAIFEDECRKKAAAGGTVYSRAFGSIDVVSYARFLELHTRHHTKQMPVA
jgi:hypothetical protein